MAMWYGSKKLLETLSIKALITKIAMKIEGP